MKVALSSVMGGKDGHIR